MVLSPEDPGLRAPDVNPRLLNDAITLLIGFPFWTMITGKERLVDADYIGSALASAI
jgi:hypothetical protein